MLGREFALKFKTKGCSPSRFSLSFSFKNLKPALNNGKRCGYFIKGAQGHRGTGAQLQ